MSKPVGAHTRKPTAVEITAESVAAAAAVVGLVDPTSEGAQEVIDMMNPQSAKAHAVDTVNPESAHKQDVPAEEQEVQYQLDPQMVQQAIMNTNARLIATMVNNNAMMEVALEQERRAHGETRAKLAALQAMYREDNEG